MFIGIPSNGRNTDSHQLVYLLSAMESANMQIDFNVSVPSHITKIQSTSY
jgi:hypothetical protein